MARLWSCERWWAALHDADRIDSPRYDLHGPRRSRGVELALAACSDAEGAAMMGRGSPSNLVQYRRQADRIRLADATAARSGLAGGG